ncbi:pyocin activator PrtN family protein [Vibrio toranzoniae]|uniref:pyocin activator PrtN family protein n=1 Tax=Vibrio toranzoniae TaxID=1194427 RepID=UPI0007F3978A|nr:pyocin activator PrtN family protein [Vibrio toranzoniae]SBS37390.1 Pyocin activator protein PrtN [Vibrio toranzoniae]
MTSRSEPTTRSLLAQQFNHQPFIPVVDVAGSLFGMAATTIKRKAAQQELPFPVVRLSDSQKSPWFVSFDDLVKFVERKRLENEREWNRNNGSKRVSFRN